MDFLLSNLNEAQKRAVLHKSGPLLIIAGAGAGKTRMIAHRLVYLVSQGIKPEQILAITFTNKATEEMRERINKLLNFQTPFVSTFHSLGVYILRKSGRALEIPKNFSILDKEDSLDIVKTAIREKGINPQQFQPAKMQALISRLKGDLITAEEFRETSGNDFFPQKLSLIWNQYEDFLKKQKALDFDDLVAKTIFLFQKDKKTKEYYQNFWQHILIDEYQDTNKSQYELAKILAEKHKNICAIGDVDQSIYGWRGADFRNILNFENDYPDHKIIIFEENYRSTQNILEAAAKVIEKNKMRKEKRLVSTREKGAEISLFEARDEEEEAEFVAYKAKELLAAKVKPSEIAVLFRANFQSRVLEESCLRHKIPYQALIFQSGKPPSALMTEQDLLDRRKDAVRLMTIHSVKGLEFEYVFITGLEQGLFPHSGYGADIDEKREEERRLFYVALTRAKEKVFLSFCASRTIFGAKQLNLPSQFLSDIPEYLLKLEEYRWEGPEIV